MTRDWILSRNGVRFIRDWLDHTPGLWAGIVEATQAPAIATVRNRDALLRIPGVKAVVGAQDVPRILYTTAGQPFPEPSPYDTLIVNSPLKYVGEPAAFVVADNRSTLDEALALVQVDYQSVSITGLWKEGEDRTVTAWDWESGVYKKSGDSVSFQSSVRLSRVSHVVLEPHGAMALWDPSGDLVIVTSTQVPFHVRRIVSRATARPLHTIRVITSHVGGGFGSKQEVILEPWVAWLAIVTGQPVKMQFSRRQEFLLGRTRHPAMLQVESTWKKGHLQSLSLSADVITGPYGAHGSTVAYNMGMKTLPLYRSPHYHFQAQVLYGLGPLAGAFRGYGAPQGAMALETHWDHVAHAHGISPVEFRKDHLLSPGDALDVFGSATEPSRRYAGVPVSQLLERCEKVLLEGAAIAIGDGIGLALSMQASGVPQQEIAEAVVRVAENGHVETYVGAVDMGQGAVEVIKTLIASVLKIPHRWITVVFGDTSRCPFDYGSYASSTTYVTGQAVTMAAQDALAQMTRIACLEQDKPHLMPQLVDDAVHSWMGGMSFMDVASAAYYGRARSPVLGRGVARPSDSPAPVAAAGIHLHVDKETGEIEVRHVVIAVDVGHVVNRKGLMGQIEGAVYQGLGYALCEEIVLDAHSNVINSSLFDYPLLSPQDLPKVSIVVHEMARQDKEPFRVKSAGEVALAPVAPAIANAVFDAVGVRITQLPITAERIWRALRKKDVHNNETTTEKRG